MRGGLAGLLAAEVVVRDINACCGILRRIFSETTEHDTLDHLQRKGQGVVSNVIALGKASLADNAPLVKHSSVTVLCHASQRLGDWKSALVFADALTHPPAPTFLSSLLLPGNWDGIIKHCKERNWPMDVPHAIRHLAERHGDWASALEVAKTMERQYHMGEWYSLGVLIPHLVAGGAWEYAVRLFDSGIAQGTLVDRKLLRNLVHQTAKLKQWKTSLYMLGTIEKIKEASHIFPTDIEFYRDVMSVSPDCQSSFKVFNVAVSAGVKPDQSMVGQLLAQCDDAGEWSIATRVYNLALAEGFISSISGSSYQTLVRSFHAAKQWEQALAALSWMTKADEASAATGIGNLLELCEQSGQWESAVSIGAMLLNKGTYMPRQTRLSFLFACSKGGQWESAMRVLKDSFFDTTEAPHPLAICAVLQACVAANRWENALTFMQKARDEEPRVVLPPLAHRLALKACVSAGRWMEAMTLVDGMRASGLSHDNHSQRLCLWATALSGNWQLSLEYLRSLPVAHRSRQDRLVIRNATKNSGAVSRAIALKYLQQT